MYNFRPHAAVTAASVDAADAPIDLPSGEIEVQHAHTSNTNMNNPPSHEEHGTSWAQEDQQQYMHHHQQQQQQHDDPTQVAPQVGASDDTDAAAATTTDEVQPPVGASDEEVLLFYRHMMENHAMAPPKAWRQIRFDLPSTVAELRLYPPERVRAQPHGRSLQPSSCVVVELDGVVPDGTSVQAYMGQLVSYLLDLMRYNSASTAITSLRFIKRGSALSQVVLTFGKDVRLATRMVESMVEAGMQASFGPPVTYFPPNATFSVVEYEAKMRNGAGITPEDLLLLLTPIKRVSQQHGGGVSSSGTNTSTSLHVVPQTPDILIVPGYEPGVFFVPVKRPESIFAILWNPFASFTYQAAMFARFGVLITMTACPHEYLHKGIPYAQQKQRLEEERARRPGSMVSAATSSNAAPSAAFMMASLVGTSNMDALLGGAEEGGAMSATGAHHAHAQHGVNGESDDDEEEEQAGSEGDENAEASWANNAEDVVDIYAALLGGGATTTEDANIATRMMQDELHFTTPTPSGVHHENNQARPMPYAHHLPQQQQQQPPVYGSAPNAYPELVDDDDDDNEDAVGTSAWTSSRQHPYEARGAQPSWKQGGGGDGILPMESGSSGAVLPQPASPPSYFTSTQTRTQPSSSSQSSSHAARGGGSVYGHQPTPTPRRPPISVDDARQLAMMVEDCVRDLLPTTYAIYAADIDASATTTTTTTTCATSEDAIMHHIAPDVRVPPMSVEMMQLMELLTKESHKILALLRCPAAEMGWEGLAEAKQQLSHALLVSIPPPRNVDDDSSDFVRQCWCARVEDDEDDDDDDGVRDEDAKKDEDDASKAVDAATPVLPSMFPYLLSTPCGVDVIAVLLQQHHARIAPLLAVYLPPFLLDAHVVQEVGCALLQVDASSSNVVVRRILRHWLPLMLWLQQLIAARASSEAASSSSSPTHVEDDDVRRNAASKRLLSQLGNTFDVFLAALSPSQRAACRAFSDEKNMLANFVELMKTSSSVDGAASGGDVAQPNTSETTTTTTKSATEVMVGDPLWGVRGAVLRTLLRLYVNADVVSGDALAHELVGEDNVVHQEHLFFAISAATRSAVSPSLSVESAIFCGNILRSIEEANNRNDAPTTTTSSSSMKMKSLGEREALQLLDAIFRSTSTDASYAALRRAYFAEPAPSPRILKIVARLSNAQRMHMMAHTEQQQQQHSILGAPAFSHNNNNNVHVGAAAQWKQAWSVAMRTYPMVGEPFTPLPASWTSSISRSYGHYYYRDASGSASYVHPADAAEYMVSPQAFVLEPKGGVKLEEIVAEANRIQRRDRASSSSSSSKTEDAPREISREDAEMWLRDQRQRHLFLDLAVLRELRITYTSSSSSSALQARGRGAGGGETQRANNTATSSSSMKTTKSMTKDELHELLRTWMHHYPTRGVPFPPLPRGWSVNMSSATGIYVFRPPSGGDGRTSSSPPTSLHPKTRGCYPVSPQAFAEQRGVSCEAIARVSCTSVEEVVRWMKDQRRRDAAMDYAVANIVPVQYAVDVMAADAAEMCRRRDGNTPPESRRRRRSRSRDSHSGSDDDDEDDDDDDDDGVSLTDSEVLRRGQRRGQTRGVRSRRGGGGRGNRGGGGGGGGARRRR